MNSIDLLGWAAASLTLLAFTSRDVRLLRLASLGASMCFITYGAGSGIWPVAALHAVLLPINLLRLFELFHSVRRTPARDGQGPACAACASRGPSARVRGVVRRLAAMALLVVCSAMPVAAAPIEHAERMHAWAEEPFRQGRFTDLANAGHPASVRYALWIYQ